MNTQTKKWEVLNKLPKGKKKITSNDIINTLLKSRGITTPEKRKEFFNPVLPEKITLRTLGLSKVAVEKGIARIKKAKKNKEKIIVYGDYDADGITGTAILWETLFAFDKETLPYIPDRFTEGYGLNPKTIIKLKEEYPNLGLIISVDNGIVANKAVTKANKLGMDVIITDHHKKAKTIPKALAIIHTTEIGGAAVAWVFAREIRKKLRMPKSEFKMGDGLDLAAIGTIADQISLLGSNRSFVKYGLRALNKTIRPGLLSLFKEAAIKRGAIGTYTVGFIVAPRINAMGRLEHAMDALRLLCTKKRVQAEEFAHFLGKTNNERRKIVDEVTIHATEAVKETMETSILVVHESYHEGVIGLVASRLVETFYKPTIVISRGKEISKASARSIPGFNIIDAIRNLDKLTIEAGGHPMAAGFSIKTSNIDKFTKEFEKETKLALNGELLTKKLKVDMELGFDLLSKELAEIISTFEPTGTGNYAPVFATKGATVIEARVVGKTGTHLKLKLQENDKILDTIAFGFGHLSPKLSLGSLVDVAYNLEENEWNGRKSLQLNARDIRIK
ncbi:single-stranded-DNA-specific exonuclease RecJ [Patescibacteria group bacterium]|nr:single-stranded-DNA-specific exonuclease RecJ [Patescibacteria group bacterium]MBU0776853.1 single-stranded-DNA-specific exonuclease RecJ [Patescibacteria group bacterium]MBU0846268.1 single-stranded-DNA-specific exonuclease RecJ [Patescibacteria group bacterium]MBU0922615.1 single-stranded-DNA-specific exonuclease RecJ [Patescibacteria group bacterium]MBU1066666.1 single-stranded-DNA-specific exonuclease RecJ [Patescibacteria group bacterium]